MKLHCMIAAGCAAWLAATGMTAAQAQDAPPSARALHERILVLDTHLDTPALLARPGWSILDRHDYEEDFSQVDLPRMVVGGLDGGFWVIYTRQGERTPEATEAALEAALRRADLIHDMVETHPEHFELALRADDAQRIADSGKRVVFISIENSYPLSGDPALVERFYDLGVRMIGPVHGRNNDFADSATDPDGAEWGGLSEAGFALVAEANRLGMVLDASHASDAAFDDMLEASATPIILSHSGPSAVYVHSRNIDDARLIRLAERGGVIQVNALGRYLTDLPPDTPERTEALAALSAEYGGRDLSPEEAQALMAARAEINRRHPPARAGLEDYAAHLLHVLDLLGPDHVGIGADWDGGGGVAHLMDVAALPRITQILLDEDYSEAEIANIWSGNVLRVLRAAEDYAASLAAAEEGRD